MARHFYEAREPGKAQDKREINLKGLAPYM